MGMAQVERVIGTLRRELLDHVIVMNERHLRRLLRTFVAKYNLPNRTHLSLDKDSPEPRAVELPIKETEEASALCAASCSCTTGRRARDRRKSGSWRPGSKSRCSTPQHVDDRSKKLPIGR